jgi:transcriptional regulator with XRE-family HTH domain
MLNLKKYIWGYTSVEEKFIAENIAAGDEVIDFPDWILQELERRGWTQSELARRAEVTPATISMILSRQKNPGVDACIGIARAFNESPTHVFRLAGLLPELTTDQEKIERIIDLFNGLSNEDQTRLIMIAKSWQIVEAERRGGD